jgi:CDP-2,3-bis-(O-geranylgeranyl)-sn-glycerol synthase
MIILENMFIIIVQAFWLLLPAGFANMAPVLFKRIDFLNYPVDFNKKLFGKPILGANKTFRGFFFGTIIGIIVVYLESLFALDNFVGYSNIILIGFLLGFGALFGDLVKSFFKRQMNIQPGKSFIPFDQIDWVVGSLVFISFYSIVSWQIILTSILLFGLLHPIINLVGYWMKLKKNKF